MVGSRGHPPRSRGQRMDRAEPVPLRRGGPDRRESRAAPRQHFHQEVAPGIEQNGCSFSRRNHSRRAYRLCQASARYHTPAHTRGATACRLRQREAFRRAISACNRGHTIRLSPIRQRLKHISIEFSSGFSFGLFEADAVAQSFPHPFLAFLREVAAAMRCTCALIRILTRCF